MVVRLCDAVQLAREICEAAGVTERLFAHLDTDGSGGVRCVRIMLRVRVRVWVWVWVRV